jgi:arylsulfatase
MALTVSIEVAFAQAKKPNILVIFGDDIGQSNIQRLQPRVVMGFTTPNIDRIRQRGRRIRDLLRAAKLHGRARGTYILGPVPVSHGANERWACPVQR